MKNIRCLSKKLFDSVNFLWRENHHSLFLENFEKSNSIAVAFSGGTDSSVLSIILDDLARSYGINLILFHVHDGLLTENDKWIAKIYQFAKKIKREVKIFYVDINKFSGLGIEADARDKRYKALIEAARFHKINQIWLAHHQDDQAETILFRLFRGSGVSGLIAMKFKTFKEEIVFLRPFLNISKEEILNFLKSYQKFIKWEAIEDPSNYDERYTRANIRLKLTPIFNKYWPTWKENLSRYAIHASEAQDILDEVASLDLKKILIQPQHLNFNNFSHKECEKMEFKLDLKNWRLITSSRQRNVFRYLFRILKKRMPSTARLKDLQRQLNQLHNLGSDRNFVFYHDSLRIICVKGVISIFYNN